MSRVSRGLGFLLALAVTGGAVAAGASPDVTIEVESAAVQAGQSVLVRGTIASSEAGEDVEVEQNPCGLGWNVLPPVRGTTGAGGVYAVWLESNATPGANMLVRTRWNGARSRPIRLSVQPWLVLRHFWGKLRVEVVGQFAPQLVSQSRYAVIEGRRSGGLWKPIGRVKLRLRNTSYGEMPVGSLRIKRSRYAFVRAVLPGSQARPCYSAAVSDPIRG
jgi:hypothetical protein